MADISMCRDGIKCKMRKKCYRYVAVQGMYQSFSEFYKDCKDNEYWKFIPAHAYRKVKKSRKAVSE